MPPIVESCIGVVRCRDKLEGLKLYHWKGYFRFGFCVDICFSFLLLKMVKPAMSKSSVSLFPRAAVCVSLLSLPLSLSLSLPFYRTALSIFSLYLFSLSPSFALSLLSHCFDLHSIALFAAASFAGGATTPCIARITIVRTTRGSSNNLAPYIDIIHEELFPAAALIYRILL